MQATFRRIALALALSEAGSLAALFVGVWGKASFRLGATAGEMAISSALWGVSAMAGGLIAGVLIDRFGPMRVLVLGEILAVPATLAFIGAESIPVLLAFVVPSSFSGAVIGTAVASFGPYLVHDDKGLSRVNASLEMAFATAFVAGPALGSVIAKTLGLDWIFAVNAMSSVTALLLLAGLEVRRPERGARRAAFAEVREGIRVAVSNRRVRVVLVLALGVWSSFGVFVSLEPLFYREVLHSGPALLGWVLAVFGAGLFLGASLTKRFPPSFFSGRGLVALGLLVGAGEIVYTATASLPVVLAGNVVMGVALGAVGPVGRTIVHGSVPETHVGRVVGAMFTVQRTGQLAPLIFVGALAAAVGVQAALVGAGVVLSVYCLALVPGARAADKVAPPAPGVVGGMPEPEPIAGTIL